LASVCVVKRGMARVFRLGGRWVAEPTV